MDVADAQTADELGVATPAADAAPDKAAPIGHAKAGSPQDNKEATGDAGVATPTEAAMEDAVTQQTMIAPQIDPPKEAKVPPPGNGQGILTPAKNGTKGGLDSTGNTNGSPAAGKISKISTSSPKVETKSSDVNNNATKAGTVTSEDKPVVDPEVGSKNGKALEAVAIEVSSSTPTNPSAQQPPAAGSSEGIVSSEGIPPSRKEDAIAAEGKARQSESVEAGIVSGVSGTAESGDEGSGQDKVNAVGSPERVEAAESEKEGTDEPVKEQGEKGADDAKGGKAEKKDGGLLQQAKDMLSVLVGVKTNTDSEQEVVGTDGKAKNTTKATNGTADTNSSQPIDKIQQAVDGSARPSSATNNKAANNKAANNKTAAPHSPPAAAGNKTAVATLAANKTAPAAKQPRQKVPPPQGKAVPTQGKVVAPQGKAVAPQGKAVPTQGKAVPTQGKAVPTQGKVVAPQGKVVAPQGKAVPAQGKAVPPQGKHGGYESIFQTLTKKSKCALSIPFCSH
jgi:hypothetical protein